MNVFYEEDGALKVGTVLADSTATLQIEAPHGKRSKIKSSAVLFRFEQPGISDFIANAQAAADGLEIDFLWECSSGEEFDYAALAREYYGRAPTPIEAAGVLLRLHGAPMYFYKKGRGRYKAAPADALKAALASVERKKQQALAKETYVAQLTAGALPPEFVPVLNTLLYRPDKNSIEWKALEEASAALKVTPVRVIERAGGIASTHDFHLNRFLLEHFPHGAGFDRELLPHTAQGLPLSEALAFSIDDATTTEIDDAFSVTRLDSGNVRVGIHIAAPALGFAAATALDEVARERLSTVYFPGGKITMLPPAAIDEYTLAADRECAAVSLYVELTPADEVVRDETRVERIRVVANLRHDTLEPLFNERSVQSGSVDHEYGQELLRLSRWASKLEAVRRGDALEAEQRPEYSFHVENDRIQITQRRRGTPIDKVVSELMIYVNSKWGQQLAESNTGAIYRVQSGGKVRMSTVPAPHAGLRVPQYAWTSSPLRRYVDLVNQRQIIAISRNDAPPYGAGGDTLLAIMREFETAYEAYSEFQRTMERYWCLRWLLQEDVRVTGATVLRENLCRFQDLPIVVRVASLPAIAPGTHVSLDLSRIDLLDLTLHCEYRHVLDGSGPEGRPAGDAAIAVAAAACNG